MPAQYRPRETFPERRMPLYCPERDLAHVGVGLIRASVFAHEERFWEDWYREYRKSQLLSDEHIEHGLTKLAEMTKLIITEKNPLTAAAAVGFDQLRPEQQMAIYGKLGQVFLAAVWSGVKDVKAMNSPTPPEVCELVETVEDFVANGAVARAQAQHGWFRRQARRLLTTLLSYLD